MRQEKRLIEGRKLGEAQAAVALVLGLGDRVGVSAAGKQRKRKRDDQRGAADDQPLLEPDAPWLPDGLGWLPPAGIGTTLPWASTRVCGGSSEMRTAKLPVGL